MKASGVLYFQIPVDSNGKWRKDVDALAQKREYKNRDVKESSRASLGDSFDAGMKMVYAE